MENKSSVGTLGYAIGAGVLVIVLLLVLGISTGFLPWRDSYAESPRPSNEDDVVVPITTDIPQDDIVATPTPTPTPTPTGSLTGITTAGLNIRAGAGKHFQVVDTYVKGTKVTVTEQKIADGVTWGKTDKGWICLSYIRVDAGTGSVIKSGKVTASALSVRSAAGTNNAIVGRYTKGTIIVILETTKVGKVTWGRTDLGWVSMDYVK